MPFHAKEQVALRGMEWRSPPSKTPIQLVHHTTVQPVGIQKITVFIAHCNQTASCPVQGGEHLLHSHAINIRL